LLENTLQSKITGWTSDFLVVCAFMAVSVKIISQWLIPILVVCLVTTVVTFAVCFYFASRFGGTNDFERTLGLYGACCGTVPSGISLVRIVDPNFHTSTAVELGASNLVMLLCTPVYFIILLLSNGTLNMPIAMGGLALCVVGYLVLLKVTRLWNKPTYNLFGKVTVDEEVTK
jgi:ESS family glutamate:Na+ symporter